MDGDPGVGMSKREVRRVLGRPAERTTMGERAASFNSLAGRVPRMETWVYTDTPHPGAMTVVSFLRGRVEHVRVHDADR